jgi:hypothetical protein
MNASDDIFGAGDVANDGVSDDGTDMFGGDEPETASEAATEDASAENADGADVGE